MRNGFIRKLLAVALALAVGVTFIPLLGDGASAAENDQDGSAVVVETGADPAEDEAVIPAPDAGADADLADAGDPAAAADADDPAEPAEDPDGLDETPPAPADGQPAPAEDAADADAVTDSDVPAEPEETAEEESDAMLLAFSAESDVQLQAAANDADLYSFTLKRSGKSLIISAAFKDSPIYQDPSVLYKKENMRFQGIFVDGTQIGKAFNSAALANYKVTPSSLGSPGIHEVTLLIHYQKDSTEPEELNAFDVQSYSRTYRVGILTKPSAKGSIEAYSKYIAYTSPVDGNLVNYKLFLEYRSRGLKAKKWSKWSKPQGPMNYLQSRKITKLKPNRWYQIRTYYGVYTNGQWFTGKQEKKFLYCGSYRTGMAKKPAVKSVTVKAYNVKKKKEKVYGYYTGLYLGKRTYYKYKIKITVKLKKKPGTKGIWINGKKFKGNKKTYTIKLGPYTNYSKPKGKKFTVAIYTYHNAKYGGYSPMYQTKKKVK